MQSIPFSEMGRARSGAVSAKGIKFSAYANAMPATKDVAPFLGRAQANGVEEQEELVRHLVEDGCPMGVEEITHILNAMGFYVMDRMPEELCSFDLGFARLFPGMKGSFPTADAEFDPARNRLYVAAVPCDDIRNALKGRTASQDQNIAYPGIFKVSWGGGTEMNEIKIGEDFTIYGSKLTLAKGDESAELILPDGSSVAIALDPQTPEDDAYTRISGRLAGPVAACEGAKIVLHTHGLDLSSSLKPIPSPLLTVLAGDTPTGITLTGVHAPGIEPPMIHLESGIWFDGTGLDGWTGGEGDEVLAKNNRAEEAEWTRVDLHEDVGGEVVFDGGMLKMDEGVWTILDNLGIVEGSEVRFKVTVGGQSAEIVATVAEA